MSGRSSAASAPAVRPEVLRLEGVGVRLGGRRVLHDVSLTLRAGDLTGIVGPNGAGKTTLLRTILGLLPTAGGTVVVGGAAERRARRIGYVPQRHEFAWDFPITVEQAVVSSRVRGFGWRRRPVVDDYRAGYRAIDRVRLTDLRGRPIGELSGGQRQRVLVARALATEPSVLLLDEPTTGLDVPSQELLADLFNELAADGTALLLTTHDLAAAMHECGRLVLLNRTVVADGAPADLRDPIVWQRAFGFRDGSPLLALLAGQEVTT